MNDYTRSSLQDRLTYWQIQGDDWLDVKNEAIASCTKLLNERCPLDDERLEEYFDRLSGPEGCNFRKVNGKSAWDCLAGNDKSKSERVLQNMGLGFSEIELMHKIVDELGGHCDCEILLNASGLMLEE